MVRCVTGAIVECCVNRQKQELYLKVDLELQCHISFATAG
jgi:hypothetical protein